MTPKIMGIVLSDERLRASTNLGRTGGMILGENGGDLQTCHQSAKFSRKDDKPTWEASQATKNSLKIYAKPV